MIVYHATPRLESEFHEIQFNLHMADPAKIIELIKQGKLQYIKVAALITNKLETAFRLTNTIDRPWWEGTELNVICHFDGEGCRSTSVGDIMYNEFTQEAYLCCSVGWEPINYNLPLHEEVFMNLDNALDNGDGIVADTPKAVAEDMTAYVASLETESVENLIPHIEAWQARFAKVVA